MVVICAKTQADTQHVKSVIEQESKDGRYTNSDAKTDRIDLMTGYIAQLNEKPQQQIQSWLDKQCYIALGNALLAAADMGIDSVAIEGFDASIIDEEFSLREKGLHSLVLAGFGYHSEADFNAKLPKSRLSDALLFSEF